MRRRSALGVVFALAPALAAAQAAKAPTGRCSFDVKAERQGLLVKLPSGQRNAFTAGNVVARCSAQGIVLRSDSLESYGDEGRIVFIGHVDYAEPRLKLKADLLTYFQREERILAVQNVDARLPSGSTIRGPQLDFLRAIPRVRPQQQATATGRPTISLVERDAQGRAQPPVRITGNTVWLQGDSVVSSAGQVVVVRPELTATGDSLYADAGNGLLRLMRVPKIVGTRGRPFTLVGETIDLLTKNRKLERVLAKNTAEAQSEDLNLKSDSIDLRVTGDLLQRAIAWGKGRARATSTTQSIVADSIDVQLPAQRVRELHAVRRATAEAAPDTTKFRALENDRLTGDTIFALFDSVPAKDTARKPRIRETIATGNATSLQHLAPNDTSCREPAVNYVRGRQIRITFVAGMIDKVTVTDTGEVSAGVRVDPRNCGRPAAASAPGRLPLVPPSGTVDRTAPASPHSAPPVTPPATKPANPGAPALPEPKKRP